LTARWTRCSDDAVATRKIGNFGPFLGGNMAVGQ
jgi:hypothetical protein